MSLKQLSEFDSDTLEQAAGFTGFGWTASMLGYVGALTGVGNNLVTRLAVEPQSLLYLGGVLLVATFGLDRLRRTLPDGEDRPRSR